jgi:hypothetical protein
LGAAAVVMAALAACGPKDQGIAGPRTQTITPARQNRVSKVDLLLMIDNSPSMADKQALLARTVPDLVSRLVDPACINPMTGLVVGQRMNDGSCAMGVPDFEPVKDLHIGQRNMHLWRQTRACHAGT